MTATELKKRAIALAEKTKIDSVTPEEVGQLSNDIVEYIENVEINGSSLGIRKTYTSVSAMEADSTAPKDDKGVLLRRGMLVNIYNQEEPDSADNGKVFSFQNPGWAFRGTVDSGYATKEELTELTKDLSLLEKSVEDINGSTVEISASSIDVGKTIKQDGTLITAITAGAVTNTYDIEQGADYYVDGYCPTISGGNTMIAYYNEFSIFISYESPGNGQIVTDYKLNIPSNAKSVNVFGNDSQKPVLKKLVSSPIKNRVEATEISIQSINKILGSNNILTPNEILVGKVITSDGSLQSATTTGAAVNIYTNISTGKIYSVTGYNPSQSGGNLLCAYYDSDDIFIKGESPGNSEAIIDYELNVPNNCEVIKLFGNSTQQAYLSEANKDGIVEKINYAYEQVNVENIINAEKSDANKAISKTGTLVTASTSGAVTNTYNIEQGLEYYADGYCPSTAGGNTMIAYYDESDTFISHEQPGNSEVITNYKLNFPSNAATVKIFGNDNQKPVLTTAISLKEKLDNIDIDIENLKHYVETSIPLIYNIPLRQKNIGDSIKILFFGSSWFMCTWWYLNKIIADLGINAELHGYYIGHSEFKEWINLYNNDLSPFEGVEASRTATRNISTNGSDWAIQTYRNNYTAQQYRDDWYNDLTTKEWDIIAFQQGAKQAPFWEEYWNPYIQQIIEVVKRNCKPWTTIAFNATWTPVTGNSYLSGLTMEEFQKVNNNNVKKFIHITGIDNVSPNGSVIWNLRKSELNNDNNLADDKLHPNNGLPMYALSACFFETFIAPIYSVSVEDSDWLPDTSTQKALVSGSSFDIIDRDKQLQVFKIIRESVANRFDFL